MKKILEKLQLFLEKIDYYRDEVLFLFIKPYWPRAILPNHITFVRFFIAAILFVLLFFYKNEEKGLILSLFAFGLFTDLLDGSVARGINRVTSFGAIIDPIADRLIIVPIAVYSLYGSAKWLLLTLFLAEIINGLVSVFYTSKDSQVGSNIFGKTKMLLMSVVFIAILFFWPKPPSAFFLNLLWLSIIFCILSIAARILNLKNKHSIQL